MAQIARLSPLSPEADEPMTAALIAGLSEVRFVPDILEIRKRYPIFYVAAVGAVRSS